jgi:hypothetical protein
MFLDLDQARSTTFVGLGLALSPPGRFGRMLLATA